MKLAEEKLPPADRPYESDTLMSNFDHEVDSDVRTKVRDEGFMANYPAMAFHATVWFEEGQFYAHVMRFHVYQGTWVADTPEELMEELSALYGNN